MTASDVDAALSTDRSLVVTWLNRGTLHLVRPEDYWWLHALTTPSLRTANHTRLAQTGVTPALAERGVALRDTVIVGMSQDDPTITPHEKCRYDMGSAFAAAEFNWVLTLL